MTAEAAIKPEYLGLLNGISVAERRAGLYLQAWADVTPNPELRCALSLVAQRETTHGDVFRQRIERLGFEVREKEDPTIAEKVRMFGDPSLSDAQKIRNSSPERAPGEERDVIAGLEARITDAMDPLTQATMRWYISEERDTAELLKQAYKTVDGHAGKTGNSAAPSSVSADAQALMACMSQGFSALQETISSLVEAFSKQTKAR